MKKFFILFLCIIVTFLIITSLPFKSSDSIIDNNKQPNTTVSTETVETTLITTSNPTTKPTNPPKKITGSNHSTTKPIYDDVEEANLTKNSVSRLSLKSSVEWIEEVIPNSGYHPKLVDLGTKWNGYRFWISYTPYPSGNDYYENPHIVGSNDLITYSDYKYAVDTPYNAKKAVRYNSDSHILYNYNEDKLELFWRYVDTDISYMCLYKVSTSNGTDWSEPEIFYETYDIKNGDIVSPAIIYDNGIYKIWFIRSYSILYQENRNGEWTSPVKIDISFENNAYPWHIDTIKTPNGYEVISCATTNKEDRKHMNLYYSISEDGLKWNKAKVILTPSESEYNWDGGGLYRASFSFSSLDGMYYVLYGARNDYSVFGTGLLFGKNMYNLFGTDLDYLDPTDETIKSLWKTIEKVKTS